MFTAKNYGKGPISIRYPRGRGCQIDWRNEMEEIEIGKGRIIREGEKLAILSLGALGCQVDKAIELIKDININPAVFDLRFLKPIDEELIKDVFEKFDDVITIEDGALKGGLASEIAELSQKYQFKGQIKNLGIPDEFIEHGKPEELHKICGFDIEGIIKTIRSFY
jgi:1-deoxy-D-xylulose-5-phosphate synthase